MYYSESELKQLIQLALKKFESDTKGAVNDENIDLWIYENAEGLIEEYHSELMWQDMLADEAQMRQLDWDYEGNY